MFWYVLIILLGAGSTREAFATKSNMMVASCETLPSTIHITKGNLS